MRVAVLMTAVAIKRGNIGHRMRARAPGKKMRDVGHRAAFRTGLTPLSPPDPRQHRVIHHSRPDRSALMLDMTAAALLYIGVKRGRLHDKDRGIDRMASHAG